MGAYEAQSAAMVAASDFWDRLDSCVDLFNIPDVYICHVREIIERIKARNAITVVIQPLT